MTAAADRLHQTSPDRPVQPTPDDSGVTVLADWTRLGQILDNLLANADRAAPTGAPIVVAASDEGDGFVAIRVMDNGPGVAPEIRGRLFTRFVKDNDQSPGGTGLGLAITRGLVEAHTGTIDLEESEQGAVFRFRLPKAENS